MSDHDKVRQLFEFKARSPMTFVPDNSALIIVDVQRYFARPEYAFGRTFNNLIPGLTDGYFERVRSHVLNNIARLQVAFRAQRRPVIFLAAGSHLGDGSDLPAWMREADELGVRVLGQRVCPPVGDPAWQIDDAVPPLPGEIVLNKTSSGALASTKLDQTLHNLRIDSLAVCGLTTAVCVTQTARELADRGFRVVVAGDACTEMSVEMHEAALFTFGYVFGRVAPTDNVVQLLVAAEPAAV